MQDKLQEITILCGGKGTRLHAVLPDLPKILAPIGEKTFLDFLISKYLHKGITKFIFCTGYKDELIRIHLQNYYPDLDTYFIHEEKPLGTGGAILNAVKFSSSQHCLIINGDSFSEFSLDKLWEDHIASEAVCTVLVNAIEQAHRFGTVELNSANKIIRFKEKGQIGSSVINAGVYLIDTNRFLKRDHPDIFSFEHDFLNILATENQLNGSIQSGYFIDIGIPQDLLKAQIELANYAK